MSLSAIVTDGVGGGRDIHSAQPSRCVCSRCKSLGKKSTSTQSERDCFIGVWNLHFVCKHTNQEFEKYYFRENTLPQKNAISVKRPLLKTDLIKHQQFKCRAWEWMVHNLMILFLKGWKSGQRLTLQSLTSFSAAVRRLESSQVVR